MPSPRLLVELCWILPRCSLTYSGKSGPRLHDSHLLVSYGCGAWFTQPRDHSLADSCSRQSLSNTGCKWDESAEVLQKDPLMPNFIVQVVDRCGLLQVRQPTWPDLSFNHSIMSSHIFTVHGIINLAPFVPPLRLCWPDVRWGGKQVSSSLCSHMQRNCGRSWRMSSPYIIPMDPRMGRNPPLAPFMPPLRLWAWPLTF